MPNDTQNETPAMGDEENEIPEVKVLSAEDMVKELGKARDALKAANYEAADRRKKLKAFEEADAKRQDEEKKRRDAELTEVQRLTKEAADAKREKDDALKLATRRLMRAQVVAEASKTFDDAEFVSVWNALNADAKLMDKIAVNDDGETFTGIDAALVEIAKQHPRWLKSDSLPARGTPLSQAGKVVIGQSNEDAKQKLRARGNYAPV